MAEYIELKSKVQNVCDYRTVDISGFIPDFKPDLARLEKDIHRICVRHGKELDCDEIQDGDLAVISCRSDNEKYCKDNIAVLVGKGLFNKELENCLPGTKKGEKKIFSVDGQNVTVSVGKVTRTVLPELTDEYVKSWGIEGVDTIETLRKHCIDKQIDRMLDECEAADSAAAYIWKTVADNSTFVLDKEEHDRAIMKGEEKLSQGIQIGDGSEDDSVSEGEEENIKDFVRNAFVTELRIAVVGNSMMKDSGNLLTLEDYEKYLEKWKNYDSRLSDAEARKKYSMEDFMINRYADEISEAIDIYVSECFKKKMNP